MSDAVKTYVRDQIEGVLLDNGLDDMGVDDALVELFMTLRAEWQEGWL
jgi:hypothetical protein